MARPCRSLEHHRWRRQNTTLASIIMHDTQGCFRALEALFLRRFIDLDPSLEVPMQAAVISLHSWSYWYDVWRCGRGVTLVGR